MHNLTLINGKAEMAFVGETPWHGLGQELRDGAGLDAWLEAAGMAWRIQRSKVRYAVEKSGPALAAAGSAAAFMEWPENHVLFRSDTKAPLGLVSDHYKVVQPRAVLQFMHELCDNNQFKMETAGTLRGGAVFWALARVAGSKVVLAGGDEVRGYCLLSTSADGTRRTEAKFTTVRVVCNNTLSMADGDRGQASVAVSHRSRFSPSDVKTDLGLMAEAMDDFTESALAMTRVALDEQDAADFALRLFHGDEYVEKLSADQRAEELQNKHVAKVLDLFRNGRGQQLASARGTAWGMVNAVTEYVDHHYPARSAANRLQSAWFGANERLKNDAARRAMKLAA